jgi:NRAMP (natural resistance-associated macrophage protein)-like metal ion transporter
VKANKYGDGRGKASDSKNRSSHNLLELLGPGLITGAADDDPSGIATYSQVGAKFGFGMLWTMLVSYPMMVAVQEISARIGRITGRGLAGNMCRVYSAWITFPLVAMLVAANVFNLGADIIAMGTALTLVVGGSAIVYSVLFTIVSLALQIFIPYTTYSNYLKWLTLVLFSYVATAFVIHVPWGEALHHTLVPSMAWNNESLMAIVAILGTTISPYLFFWQASTEVEEVETHQEERPLKEAPEQAEDQLGRIRLDTLIGMAASNIVAFFIILTAAVTLHAHGKTNISSAAEAAEALRPLAGQFAFLLFSLGIIGTGLLALPVLAGSAAYAVGEAFHWPTGLQQKPWRAKRFYAVIVAAMLLSLLLDFVGLDPIKALVLSAAINGIVAVPILAILMLMSRNPRIMDKFRISKLYAVLGWITTCAMGFVAIALLASLIK